MSAAIPGNLKSRLASLTRTVIERVNSLKQSKDIVQVEQVQFSTEIPDESAGCSAPVVPDMWYTSGPQWQWRGVMPWGLVESIRTTEDYCKCVEAAIAECPVDRESASHAIDRYIFELSRVAVEPLPENIVEDHINGFSDYLADRPLEWQVTLTLSGLKCHVPCVDLGNGVTMKCANNGIAVVQWHLTSPSWQNVHQEVDNLLDVLRLFKIGALVATKEMASTVAAGCWCPYTLQDQHSHVWRDYTLHAGEVDSLKRFILQVKPLLPPRKDLEVGMEWYREALTQRGSFKRRITSATICLESLYLNDEKGEVTRKVCQRAALYLGLRKFAPLDVLKNVKEAYRVRSGIVHGSRSPQDEPDHELEQLCNEVLAYARITLLVMLQLKESRPKLVTEIDKALVDPPSLERLRAMVLSDKLLGQAPERD